MFRFKVFEKPEIPAGKSTRESQVQVIRKKKGTLYKEGDLIDMVFLLLKGNVALSKKHANGQKVYLKDCEPGYFLGLHRSADNLMTHSARIRRECALLSIPLSCISLLRNDVQQEETLIAQIIQDIDYFYSKAFSG